MSQEKEKEFIETKLESELKENEVKSDAVPVAAAGSNRAFYVDPIPLKDKIIENFNTQLNGDKSPLDNLPQIFLVGIEKVKAVHDGIGAKIEKVARLVDQFAIWEHIASSGLIVTAFVLSSVIQYFQLGWMAYLLSFWYLSYLYKVNIDRLRYKIKAITIKEEKIGFNDSDQETLEWFNGLVERLWTNFEADVNLQIRDQITNTLDGLKVSGFDEIRLAKFSLGSQAPRIETVKNFASCDDDNFVLDFDLLFFPYDEDSVSNREKRMKELRNFELVIEAVVAKIPLPVALKEIFFNGQLRVAFQFTKTTPYIKIPLGAEITKIAGLGSMIKDVVKTQVDAMIVNPAKMTFNLDEMLNGDQGRKEIPAGVLRIIIYEAQGLKNIDLTGVTFSNPAVLIKLGGQEVARTGVQSNTLDPEWNSVHDVIINYGVLEQGDLTSDITFEVVNVTSTIGGATTSLGSTVTYPLSKWLRAVGIDFAEEGPLSKDDVDTLLLEWGSPFEVHSNIWKDVVLDKKRFGNLRLDVSYYPVVPLPAVEKTNPSSSTTAPLDTPSSPLSPDSAMEGEMACEIEVVEPKRVAGVVTVTLNQAKELSKGHNGAIQCIGKIDGLEVVKSAIRKRTINPSWGSKHSFYCADISSAIINFGIFNKGNLIGECKVNLQKAKDSTDSWYKLGGGTGKLSVDVKFMGLDADHSSIEPERRIRYNPRGLMRLRLIGASDLPLKTMDKASMGLSKLNSYCKVFLQDRIVGATSTQEKTLEPRWNETFKTATYSSKERISFEVFDESTFSKDNSLGHFDASLDDLVKLAKNELTFPEGAVSHLALFVQHGLRVSQNGNKFEVWAPLYKKSTDVDEEGPEADAGEDVFKADSTRSSAIDFMKKINLKNVTGGLTNIASTTVNVIGQTANFALDPLSILQGTQKGQLHFEFEVMEVKSVGIIDSIPLVASTDAVQVPAADSLVDVNGENVKSATKKELIAENRSGLLRIRAESITLHTKCSPYLQVLCDDYKLFSTHAPKEKAYSTFLHTCEDIFITNLTTSLFELCVLSGDEGEDVIIGNWKGDFVEEILGNGKVTLNLRSHNVVVGSVTLSAAFFPIDCGDILKSSDTGLLHLDIVNAQNLALPYHCYAVSTFNGKELCKSKAVKKSASPEFGEGFDVEVHSRLASNIFLELFEKKLTQDVLIGYASISLDNLVSEKVAVLSVPLDAGISGSFTIRYKFEERSLKSLSALENNSHRFKQTNSVVGKIGKGVLGKISGIGNDVVNVVNISANLLEKKESATTMRNPLTESSQTLVEPPIVEEESLQRSPSKSGSMFSKKSVKWKNPFSKSSS